MNMESLRESIEGMHAVNTHCHHFRNDFFVDLDLDKMLRFSYVNWCNVPFDESLESKGKYLDKVKYNSYFVFLQKSLRRIYGFKENLTPQNWDFYSSTIRQAHADKNWHKSVLKKFCLYDRIIVDTRWDPGSNNDEPGIFASTFRVDPLFFGFSRDAYDHDGNNTFKYYGKEFDDIDSYIVFVKELIRQKIGGGCVSVKCAIAYDRTLKYEDSDRIKANRVFETENPSKEDIKSFQDYLFDQICTTAATLDVPIQCHTGLACLNGTNAINMLNIIKNHPETRFVLFHGSYPWIDDIMGLLHVLPNVYPDICWLPIISPSAAEHALHQLIEVGTADKVCWGCDTWTSEESFGARLAINMVLENVLAKKVKDGYIDARDAVNIAQNILYRNPKSIYKLKI